MSTMTEEVIEVVSPFLVNVIVNKDNFRHHLNSKIISRQLVNKGVTTDTIPVDLSGLKHLRDVKVAAGTSVPEHAHVGPIVRVLTHGDATVNGTRYEAGDWMIIPPKTPYTISTEHGYRALGFCHMWS